MTPETLRAWIRQRHLSHEEAADLLGLSVHGLRKNLYGVNPVNPQTERIMTLLDAIYRYHNQDQLATKYGENKRGQNYE